MAHKQKYETEIVLGKRYRDTQTKIEGTAVAITFYQYGCERVVLETVVAGKIEEYGFDTPRVVDVETGDRATTARTGGPRDLPRRGTTGGLRMTTNPSPQSHIDRYDAMSLAVWNAALASHDRPPVAAIPSARHLSVVPDREAS